MLGWSEARTVPGQTDRKEGDQGNHGNGCNIQVSIHLSLKFLGQNIYQRGYITSSTAPILGLGHNMGCFPPFVLGFTQILHRFLGSKKVVKKSKLRCHVLDFM